VRKVRRNNLEVKRDDDEVGKDAAGSDCCSMGGRGQVLDRFVFGAMKVMAWIARERGRCAWNIPGGE
jgi:hypothetical protein